MNEEVVLFFFLFLPSFNGGLVEHESAGDSCITWVVGE